MCLSCNFVNVYTIAYRVQYTFTRVHARIPNGHPREVGQDGGQVGEDRRACPARGKLNGEVAEHADILATILARAEVGEDVRVGVVVRVGPMEFQLKSAASCLHEVEENRIERQLSEMCRITEILSVYHAISSLGLFYDSECRAPKFAGSKICLLYTSPSPRDRTRSRMPSSA